jgi:23S rRNA pseudouridine955/2504/2580 synthase
LFFRYFFTSQSSAPLSHLSLSHIGHPLLGDNQYGNAKQNEKYGRMNGQALCAYRLIFDFEGDPGCLEGLNGRTFQVRDVPFVREYFKDVVIPQP